MSQFAVTAQIITGGRAGDHHMTIEAINFDEALKAARAELRSRGVIFRVVSLDEISHYQRSI